MTSREAETSCQLLLNQTLPRGQSVFVQSFDATAAAAAEIVIVWTRNGGVKDCVCACLHVCMFVFACERSHGSVFLPGVGELLPVVLFVRTSVSVFLFLYLHGLFIPKIISGLLPVPVLSPT